MATDDAPTPTHRVAARRAGVWWSPDPSAEPDGRYRRGDELTVVHEAAHGWVQVVDARGHGGWVDGTALEPVGDGDRSRRGWSVAVAAAALLAAGAGAVLLIASDEGDDGDDELVAEPVATTVVDGPRVPLGNGLVLVPPGDWAVDEDAEPTVVAASGLDLHDTSPTGIRIEVGPVTDPDPEPVDVEAIALDALAGELEVPEMDVLEPGFAGSDAVVYDLTVEEDGESSTTRTVILPNGDDEPVLVTITAPTDGFDEAVDEVEAMVESA